MSQPLCDVLVTRDGRVFINGHPISNVVQMSLDRDMSGPSRLTLELVPTSVVHGDPPASTFGETGLSDPDAKGGHRSRDCAGQGTRREEGIPCRSPED